MAEGIQYSDAFLKLAHNRSSYCKLTADGLPKLSSLGEITMKRMANGMPPSPGTEKTLYLVLLISNACDIYEEQMSDLLLVFQIHSLYLNVGCKLAYFFILSGAAKRFNSHSQLCL